jgi:hypothetical protein
MTYKTALTASPPTSEPFSYIVYPELAELAAGRANIRMAMFYADVTGVETLSARRGLAVFYPKLTAVDVVLGGAETIVNLRWKGRRTTTEPWEGTAFASSLLTDDRSIVLSGAESVGPSPITHRDSLPRWTVEALSQVLAQQSLPENWDSYGGLPVSDQHARVAWRFLERVMTDDLPLPDFIPLGDGGVQLEWEIGDTRLSFTTEEGQAPEVWLTTASHTSQVPSEDVRGAFDRFRQEQQQRA